MPSFTHSRYTTFALCLNVCLALSILFHAMQAHAGRLYNPEAPIPPQCYTQTQGDKNPCYVCHQTYKKSAQHSNGMSDGFQQGSYAFSDDGLVNSWKNLFIDRRDFIQSIPDQKMLRYVQNDNYTELLTWMATDEWQGVIPGIKNLHKPNLAFDNHGLALDGSRWVAYNYKPFPSTFWPTNGSTGDAMIRLPRHYSEFKGEFNKNLYFANLALLELAISGRKKTTLPPFNEQEFQVDINGNNRLETQVTHMIHRPFFLGDASHQKVHHMLYPKDTEFLHTVRYIGVNDAQDIYNAERMKEVRYMKKTVFLPDDHIASVYYREAKEKHFENLPQVSYFGDKGMSNKFGWLIWGFIEDTSGKLRKQNEEELFACSGCHKSIGSNIDHTFSFPRKISGTQGWGYIDLKKIDDMPSLNETQGEYLTYMTRVKGGDEYRQNTEMLNQWFNSHGEPLEGKIRQAPSLYELITPSPQRAMALNKAYYAIVQEQSYLYGRDAVIKPAVNVFKDVDPETTPLKKEFRYRYDIRLQQE